MTIYNFSRLGTAIFQSTQNQRRPFFYWIVLVFNRVDEDRIKQLGPDRACAEWLLRNGASVRWKGFSEKLTDFNALPSSGNYYIEAVEANNAGICDVGFAHFEGCKYINEIKLENCEYIDNKAMTCLSIVKDTLKILEIIDCKRVDDNGLRQLKALKNLERLKVRGLPGIVDETIQRELKQALPNCKVNIGPP
ncbi:ATP synthase subunit s, mitochondrial [Ceratina calcarata]|uniref:ATP synthase subunit s, mitochondrial n=1 Tax=Ceratina calcarata TaxID=156304 RepID=A0AAJ7ITE2_9HYME|nr:ATP synthase subunit s, mitochondrial [Ceratina calcarata]